MPSHSSDNRKSQSRKARARRIRKIHRTQSFDSTSYQHVNISSKKYNILDNSGTLIGKLYPNILDEQTVQTLDAWMTGPGQDVVKRVEDCRGKHEVAALGIHTQLGHFTIHWTPQSKTPEAQLFLEQTGYIWTRIANTVTKDFPSFQKDMEQNIPKQFLPFGNLFSFLICNFSPIKKEHIDQNDHDLCVVLPTSHFTGGAVYFRYLKLAIQVRVGDMLVFNSHLLWHGVLKSVGSRRSIVLTTHNSLIRAVNHMRTNSIQL